MSSFDAKLKFWSTPEMVATLFPFLDLLSMSKLAQAHKLVAKILQDNPSTWKILLRRCSPFFENRPHDQPDWTRWVNYLLLSNKPDVTNLTEILREMKDPKMAMLELLHVICERFPPIFDEVLMEQWGVGRYDVDCELVQLKCPGCPRSPHQVSQLGFLLLEEVEGAFGSGEQAVEKVLIANFDGPWLNAINSRVSRQSVLVKKVSVGSFYYETDNQLEELSLINNCSFVVDLDTIICGGSEVGMATIARLLPGLNARVRCLSAVKGAFKEGGGEVLKTIRDALGSVSNDGMFFLEDEVDPGSDIEIAWKTEAEKEQQWKRMTEILDLAEKEKEEKEEEEEEEEEEEKNFG